MSDKIAVLENLLDKVDAMLIGGGMAYTFLQAAGGGVGLSMCDESCLPVAMEILNKAKRLGVSLYLPVDAVCNTSVDSTADPQVFPADDIPDDMMGLDIGPKTRELFKQALASAKTVVWNGPMGVFEDERYAGGTRSMVEVLANLDAVTVIGGGDSAAAATQMGYADRITHISTGGGASLEFLEGKDLPGIACLADK